MKMITDTIISISLASISIIMILEFIGSKSYQFQIDSKWIGNYSSFENCIKEEKTYQYIKQNNEDFRVYNSTCEYRSNFSL